MKFYSLICIFLPMMVTGQTVEMRILPPEGYTRIPLIENSFGTWLRQLPLKPEGSKVLLYNGEEKRNQAAAFAVLDIDVGTRDLQQCADAIIRLRAEYLYDQKAYDQIHFNFTNGFKAEYIKWAEGSRIKVDGNRVSWYVSGEKDYSYKNFRAYLDMVFIYAGTASLSAELNHVDYTEMHPGDVFIQGGFPGHAVIVMDMAINHSTGKKKYLLVQSYMPAQSIHILVNPSAGKEDTPWYDLDEYTTGKIQTPEWTFNKTDLKRF